jgi:heme-degrading monooxygenase HmoA
MMVVTEHRGGDEFLGLACSLLEALGGAEGFLDGKVGRSPDDPQVWTIVTSWRDVGSMRRGFGSFDAKVAAAPVMVSAVDRVSAFEVMLESSGGGVEVRSSDLSED